ncbi:MAG: preprotein translocase subunit SecG [Campylobacterota bacterium]|nr:preprotein translocase subunit SecG [Campylobacterota bacterium]
MTSTLLIFQIVLSLVITVTVLLQKSSSIGLGAYSGSNETMFGAKGPAGFLAKFTFIVAILFIINTLALGYFYNQENSKSVVSNIQTNVPSAPVTTNSVPDTTTAPVAPIKATESAPIAEPAETKEEATASPVTESNTATTEEATKTDTNSEETASTTVNETNASN